MKLTDRIICALIVSATMSIWGCSDFIVKDITDETVKILAPPDSFHSNSPEITLWWEEVDGAEDYNLQIVSQSFDYVVQLILDSTITTNKFYIDLTPGEYQWRVKAINNGGESGFTTQTFYVDSISDLTNITVNLLSPISNFFTNETEVIFKWSLISGADEYRFQLVDNGNGSLLYDITTTKDTVHYSLAEGSYTWKVRAQNSSSNSQYSERIITIDLIPPDAPTPLEPANDDTLKSPYHLKWSVDPSSSYDSLYIYSDITLSILILKSLTADTTYNFTSGIMDEDYYWRLKSFDNAENASPYSVLNKFIYGQ